MGKSLIGTCELCRRTEVKLTVHHLVPKEMGGTFLSTAYLCIPCHKQIHALYMNEELAVRLNTLEDLRRDANISGYIKWIRKQPSSKMIKTKKSKDRKRKKGSR
ncbi:HNH endonuclease [Metabacillus sp. RGM 3146]|uniref:HNH endonuclease n=1 Tax=Metabacillus sp. RGM 3146 TaxID=3401092 RepID=UPI003B9A410C